MPSRSHSTCRGENLLTTRICFIESWSQDKRHKAVTWKNKREVVFLQVNNLFTNLHWWTDILFSLADGFLTLRNFSHETNTTIVTAKFLYDTIIIRFGCPLELVSDQGSHFLNEATQILVDQFLITHRTSTPYYPQGNGKAESTNKVIGTLLIKLVNDKQTDWSEHLPIVLFAYRTTYKVTTNHIPYQLLYGLQPLLPTEYIISTYRNDTNCDYSLAQTQVVRFEELKQNSEEMHKTPITISKGGALIGFKEIKPKRFSS